ncbi:MAG: tRNA1(Val) (adenine(37)-N6)-methyltransferase [Polaribacter sp.]
MKPFQFKEFTVCQEKTAMKIGTDAVLLGAWVSVNECTNTILDIGSGTGVIALMLTQRFNAQIIDAVEIDENAHEQTVENFEQSDWGDRLYCYHAAFQEFATQIAEEEETYDCIVSNPPFYTDAFKTKNDARNTARFTSSLTFDELLKGVSKILSKDGTFAVIIPYKEEENFVALALKYSLFLNRSCRVQGNLSSEIKRSLLQFSLHQKTIKTAHLIIETARHKYTEAYINLTKDFYLNM